VELPQHQPEHAVMASVWARAQVKQLMLDMARQGQSAERVEKITQLGLDYSLMTQWTSFVAVEEKVVNEGGRQQTIMQPVEMPEGVDYDGVFGQAQDAAVPMPKSVGALRFKAMAPPPLAYPTPALAPAAGLSVTPQATTRINRLGQSQSGLLNRQEANFGRVEMKEERAERAAVTPENCQRQALSVSGGLKYPQVEQTLKAAWSQLCREAQGKYNTPTRFDVELHIAADGAVSKVLLTHQGKVSDALFNSVRDWFRKLQFGAVAGAQAKVKLRLLLQP
jgi:Ca-activated chloride channel family protein